MGSSGPSDRSLGSGISLPQWMKGKVDSRFDFDQTTFSPPSDDGSFFYIRYPKSSGTAPEAPKEGFQPISSVLNDPKSSKNTQIKTVTAAETESIAKIKKIETIDFSKHPRPCQPFIPVDKNKGENPSTIVGSRNKSQGVDDGFHGEPARCGKSIVYVANRMMSNALGKKVDGHSEYQMEKSQVVRRGSKSLPVSPIASPISTPDSSPKSRRRLLQPNRFFTGAFISDRDKQPGGWILAGLLNQSREVIDQKITEEDEASTPTAPVKPLSRKKSISTQNLSYINTEKVFHDAQVDATVQQPIVIQVAPSELREMNFWSPTSM